MSDPKPQPLSSSPAGARHLPRALVPGSAGDEALPLSSSPAGARSAGDEALPLSRGDEALPAEFELTEAELPEPPAKLDEQITGLIRKRADLLNQLDDFSQSDTRARRKLLLSLLDVVAAFHRIFSQTDLAELDEIGRNRVLSLQVASQMLWNVLVSQEVMEMDDPLGQIIDPARHTVVEVQSHPGRPRGEILAVVEKGYLWREQVLRHAKVIVCK